MTQGARSARRTRIASYAIAIDNGAILVARIAAGYPGQGRWTLPGGGVEWGEHPDDALVREVHEETGFSVTEFSLIGVNSRVFTQTARHQGLHAVRMLYDVPLRGEPRVVEVNGSVDAAAWLPLDEIAVTDTVELVRVGLEMMLR
ncbi:MAG: NUDIX hydrolase [Actinomycetota bacterium]